jgi:hypothetical protein
MAFVPGKTKPTIGAQRTSSTYSRRTARPIPQPLMPSGDLKEISRRITMLQHQLCTFQEEVEGLISDLTDVMKMEFNFVCEQLRYTSPVEVRKH